MVAIATAAESKRGDPFRWRHHLLRWQVPHLAALSVFAALSCAVAHAEDLPLNPDVSQATIGQTICVIGWTKTVRPPAAYTNRLKRKLFDEFGLPLELIADFQLDHKIPLSLGGAPSDPRNFQLMDIDDAERKDDVERCLSRAVCAGAVPLDEARKLIWQDWKKAGKRC
jgi:hypothetical protein